jgi:nitrite reductase/ring-hydroxylating ferredoxin subunit
MVRVLGLFLLLAFFSCDNDRGDRNPYLQEIGFRLDMNLNLPLYSPLTNLGNAVYVDNAGIGTRGVFVVKSSFDQYRAFEASCPNHVPNDCSTMALEGQTATCSCENYEYSLFTGQLLNRPEDGNRYYDMLEYSATQSGNVVVISN